MTDDVVDLYRADEVEIALTYHEDGWRLWVNVEGINRLRIYRIKEVALHVHEDLV